MPYIQYCICNIVLYTGLYKSNVWIFCTWPDWLFVGRPRASCMWPWSTMCPSVWPSMLCSCFISPPGNCWVHMILSGSSLLSNQSFSCLSGKVHADIIISDNDKIIIWKITLLQFREIITGSTLIVSTISKYTYGIWKLKQWWR